MIAGMRAGNPSGNVRASEYFVKIEPDTLVRRRLSWTPERSTGVVYHVIMDGITKYVSDVTYQTIKQQDINPRAIIEVIETSPQNREESLLNVVLLPDDRVLLSWAPVTGATKYNVYRKLGAGSYGAPIYKTKSGPTAFSHTDGPLNDGSYTYKLEAENDTGGTSFEEEPVVISSAPQAPTNIQGSWNPATHILTLTWTASPSSDLNHYAIRHNGGTGPVRIDDTPEDTEFTTTWTIDLTGQTGDYEFLVRAVDNDSKEEQNLSQMVAIRVVNGVAENRPSVPDKVDAVPISGGKAEVSWTYWPSRETGFGSGGAAKEARIYSDGGTGTMDFVTPVAVVAMDFPTDPQRYSWESGVLANDTYLYAVRIATATGGGGYETENTDTHEVTTDDSVPGAVDLDVEVL